MTRDACARIPGVWRRSTRLALASAGVLLRVERDGVGVTAVGHSAMKFTRVRRPVFPLDPL